MADSYRTRFAAYEAKVDLPTPEVPTTETRRTAAEPSNRNAHLSPSTTVLP
jgi:hypothetical protein